MHRLILEFAARQCDKNRNLVPWPKWVIYLTSNHIAYNDWTTNSCYFTVVPDHIAQVCLKQQGVYRHHNGHHGIHIGYNPVKTLKKKVWGVKGLGGRVVDLKAKGASSASLSMTQPRKKSQYGWKMLTGTQKINSNKWLKYSISKK